MKSSTGGLRGRPTSPASPKPSSGGTGVSVSSCRVLDSPGTTYVRSNNIGGGGVSAGPGIDACIVIAQDGITLNLNGFRIDGSSNTIVVKAGHSEVDGPGTITAYSLGPAVTIVNGSSNRVKDVTLTLSFLGINVLNSNNNWIMATRLRTSESMESESSMA